MIEFVNNTLLFNISLRIKHYLIGPPKPSWDLKFHQIWAMIKSMSENASTMTIEQMQSVSFQPDPTPAGVMINEFKINNKYKHEAQVHLNKILKPYEHVLDPEWKNLKDGGINAEWVHVSNDGWEKREIRKTILYFHGGAYYLCNKDSYRNVTGSLSKWTNARVLAIDYQLAPQNPFPAALQDALAAYLYLLNPSKDTGFEPLNPKNIVIAGDSAGGGLSLALGLAIRDAGLPSCADDECVDFIPKFKGSNVTHAESQVLNEYKEKTAALTEKIKKQNLGPKIWHDSFDRPDGVLQFYAPNEGLAIPYVSPMLAESLGNLPPLLLVAGDEERIRDEIIYLAHRSAEPTKYKGPSYNAGLLTLEHPSTTKSYERTSEFINRVINSPNEPLPPSSYNCINVKGEFNHLKEHHKKVLNWEEIGIVPSITRNEFNSTSHRLTPKLLISIGIVSVLAYVLY
ncbi:hypothetical protein RhiirC2_816866 [Rhizophagus irregularis]|uniref:Alpha/beta hydrolase fold-3 domain-containing protein n=1 Tax=Rhizophagus irregularis TaxID=588596 RepID=A0A2N1MI92_9GLOM|nr:hypothetical protein RhiirC2_816866 [Rhizophagus irregularis]